ncbi:hypothetical protein HFP66_00175 [Bacillus sp. A17A.1]
MYKRGVDEATYYLDTAGNMKSGFVEIDGDKYFFKDNGEMQTGIVNNTN